MAREVGYGGLPSEVIVCLQVDKPITGDGL